MLSALIHTNRGPDIQKTSAASGSSNKRQLRLDSAFQPTTARKTRGPCATIIVAPTSLLTQWAEELERCSKPDTLDVIVWHGTNRLDIDTLVDDDEKINVVVTSYGVLASEHAKVERLGNKASPLYRCKYPLPFLLLGFG